MREWFNHRYSYVLTRQDKIGMLAMHTNLPNTGQMRTTQSLTITCIRFSKIKWRHREQSVAGLSSKACYLPHCYPENFKYLLKNSILFSKALSWHITIDHTLTLYNRHCSWTNIKTLAHSVTNKSYLANLPTLHRTCRKNYCKQVTNKPSENIS